MTTTEVPAPACSVRKRKKKERKKERKKRPQVKEGAARGKKLAPITN